MGDTREELAGSGRIRIKMKERIRIRINVMRISNTAKNIQENMRRHL
jgi:hypothetical protein